MDPKREPLRLYGSVTDLSELPWSWVDEQLAEAGTYWIVGRGDGAPHPRPVWGVWLDATLRLSIGGQVLARCIAADPIVTVHLDSGTEVVVVEGEVTGTDETEATIASYDAKYEWTYDLVKLGPLTVVRPTTVLSWRSAGWAGREDFQAGGRWSFG